MSAEAARRWAEQSNRKRRGETSDAEAAFKKVHYSAESRLPPAATRRMIDLYFRENEDLSVPTYRVSLICPLSKARMLVAARGVNCAHIQCFDLETYLQFQVQNSLWACPIAGCSKEARQAQLRIDQYFCDALETLGNRPEVTDVDLLPNGEYAVIEPPICDDVPDDGSHYVPEPVEPKREPLDVSDDLAAPYRSAPAANSSPPFEPVVVDVIVIDDDEPVQTSTATRRRQSKCGKRRAPTQKEMDKLHDTLVKKEAELNLRKEELLSANKEILRLRMALDGKERQDDGENDGTGNGTSDSSDDVPHEIAEDDGLLEEDDDDSSGAVQLDSNHEAKKTDASSEDSKDEVVDALKNALWIMMDTKDDDLFFNQLGIALNELDDTTREDGMLQMHQVLVKINDEEK